MADSPLTFVVLGGGGIVRKAYLPLLRTWPGASLAGLYSRTRHTVDSVCLPWQIERGTTEVDELIDLRPQAAFLLTKTETHFELAQKLMRAGIDVFVEKPATLFSTQTRELAELSETLGRVFMVGFNRRYALLYRQAKKVFAGRPVEMCVVQKHRPSAYTDTLFYQLVQDNIHQIDLLRYLAGDAAAVHTEFERRETFIVGINASMRLANGGLGVLLASLDAGGWQEHVTLMGGGLTVEISAFREMRVRYPDHEEVYGGDRPGQWLPELRERGFEGEITEFFDCVRTRRKPENDAFDSVKTQELVEGVTRAAGEDLTPSDVFIL